MVQTDSRGDWNGVRTADAETQIPLNELFDALADERRRRVLRYLRDCDPPIGVERIAGALADDDADDRRTLKASLHHRELPRLDDSGLISYEGETNRVVDCDRIEDVDPYLATAGRLE